MARGSDPYRQLMPIPKARLILKSPCDGKLKYVIFENVLFFNILINVVTNYHIAVMEYHRNGGHYRLDKPTVKFGLWLWRADRLGYQ
jgi:hypothetical protein